MSHRSHQHTSSISAGKSASRHSAAVADKSSSSSLAAEMIDNSNTAVHPVTPQTIRLLDEMQRTLTCTLCHNLLNDPHSLPCQHHFCLSCISGPLDRSSLCPTCHNAFWAKDLICNTSINSMVENYTRMKEWVMKKAKEMGQLDEHGRLKEMRTNQKQESEENEWDKNRKHRREPSPDDEDRNGGDDGKENRQRRGSARTRTSKSPQTSKTAASTPASTNRTTTRRNHATTAASTATTASTAAAGVASRGHTPPRASLKDTLAAAASTPNYHHPTNNASHQQHSATFHPNSHTKNFSKQSLHKSHSPVPMVQSSTHHPTAAAAVIDGDDEDEVMEVSADSFKERKKVTKNQTNQPQQNHAAASSSSVHKPTAFARPSNGMTPTTVKQYFANAPVPTGRQQPSSSTAVASSRFTNPVTPDRDGDVRMQPATNSSYHSPSAARSAASSLSSKLLSNSDAPDSQPPLPIEASLSLPRYASQKDSLGSPPPLEQPPPINLYSPAPPVWGDTIDQVDSQMDDRHVPSPQQPTSTAAISVNDPPPRRSLAAELANLQPTNANTTIASPLVAPAAAPIVHPTAAALATTPVVIVPSTPSTGTSGNGSASAPPPSPHRAISRGASHATASSIQLSLPILTETTGVMMPSMNGASAHSHSELQSRQQQQQQPHPTHHSVPQIKTSPSLVTPPVLPLADPQLILMDSASATPILPLTTPSSSTNSSSAGATTTTPTTRTLIPGSLAPPTEASTLSLSNDVAATPSPPPPSSLVTKPISIAFSALSVEEKNQLAAFTLRVGSTLVTTKHWSQDVTHVVSKLKVDHPHRLASRSMKYMHGVLCGAWVVSWLWVEASIRAGKWVEETPYELEGDASAGAIYGPSIMRQRLAQSPIRLFKDMKFCIAPDLAPIRDPSAVELKNLIEFGQGVLIPTPTSMTQNGVVACVAQAVAAQANGATAASSSSHLLGTNGISRLPLTAGSPGPIYLIMRSDGQKVYEPRDMQALGSHLGMIPITVPWLLGSISHAKILVVGLFRLDYTQEQKMKLGEELRKEEENKLQQQQQQVVPQTA